MPKSKKPRKKGAHGREQAARSRLLRNQFKDPAECRRLVKIVEDARAARHKGSAQLGYLFALADQDFMVERFIEAFMALERWQTTEEMDDFSLVNSMLMIGAIAFLKVGVQESERLDEIRRAAYAATLAIGHRNMGRRIPDELIEDTREGLTTAQMIFEAATANGMNQELIEVLKENDPEHIARTIPRASPPDPRGLPRKGSSTRGRAGRTRQPYEGDGQAPAASSTTRQLGNHHEQHRNAPRRTTSQDEPAP